MILSKKLDSQKVGTRISTTSVIVTHFTVTEHHVNDDTFKGTYEVLGYSSEDFQ